MKTNDPAYLVSNIQSKTCDKLFVISVEMLKPAFRQPRFEEGYEPITLKTVWEKLVPLCHRLL